MSENANAEESSTSTEIEVTPCPECGTEWETVVTRRREARRDGKTVQG